MTGTYDRAHRGLLTGRLVFPLEGMSWRAFRDVLDLRGADDGVPGRGGWHHRRSDTHLHRGIDLKGPIGLAVLAVEDGLAEYRAAATGDTFDTAGHRVHLTGRSGAGYRYLHLGTDMAAPADAFPPGVAHGAVIEVMAGDVLGFLGHTGGSVATGEQIRPPAAHLHFEYHVAGTDRNPARLFERNTMP